MRPHTTVCGRIRLHADNDNDYDYDYDNDYDDEKIKKKLSNESKESAAAGGSAPAPHTSEAFLKFQQWIADNAPQVARMKEPMTEDQLQKLKAEYSTGQICEVLQAMHNHVPLTRRNTSAYLTALNWLRRRHAESANPQKPTNHEPKLYDDL